MQKLDFLINDPAHGDPLRDGINQIFHAEESGVVKQLPEMGNKEL